jgi:hypothetical protein
MEYIPQHRRNMEPPDVTYRLCGIPHQNRISIAVLQLCESTNLSNNIIYCANMSSNTTALRIRGAACEASFQGNIVNITTWFPVNKGTRTGTPSLCLGNVFGPQVATEKTAKS